MLRVFVTFAFCIQKLAVLYRQHARISDQGTVRFLDHIFGCMPQSELLFNCSANVFRARWNRLFAHLGINTSERNLGITPKSLRGSGASWFFHHTEDLDRVLWRGRWSAKRTLEHYLHAGRYGASFAQQSPSRKT